MASVALGAAARSQVRVWQGPLPERPPFPQFCYVCALQSPATAAAQIQEIEELEREILDLPSGELMVVRNPNPFVPGGRLAFPERHEGVFDSAFVKLLFEALDILPEAPTLYASNRGSVPQHVHAHWLHHRFSSLAFLDALDPPTLLSAFVATPHQHPARPLVVTLPPGGDRLDAARVLFDRSHGLFVNLETIVAEAASEKIQHHLDDPSWVIVMRPRALALFYVSRSRIRFELDGERHSMEMPGHVLVLNAYRKSDRALLEKIRYRPWEFSLTAQPEFGELLQERLAAAIHHVRRSRR